jgi:hypothetical protein
LLVVALALELFPEARSGSLSAVARTADDTTITVAAVHRSEVVLLAREISYRGRIRRRCC